MASDAARAMYPALAKAEQERKPETPKPSVTTKPGWAQSTNNPAWAEPRQPLPYLWWVPYHRKQRR
jgi:hypothetical protein